MYGNIVHAIPKGILRIYNTMILDLRETIDLMRKVSEKELNSNIDLLYL